MKKYSGILLCSDFDGTLCVDGKISKENMEAIKYFRDNGGLFTLSTGRYPEFVLPFFDEYEFNTPLIVLNGAALYDTQTGEIFDERYSDISMELIDTICKSAEGLREINVYTKGDYRTVLVEDRETLRCLDFSKIYKIVFRAGEDLEIANRAKELITNIAKPPLVVAKSWHWGIEIQNEENTKGSAARRLAEKMGAHTLVCVGDFENDISMIAEADIGYAVGDAVDSLKAAADRITVNARDNAIAKIIYEL